MKREKAHVKHPYLKSGLYGFSDQRGEAFKMAQLGY